MNFTPLNVSILAAALCHSLQTSASPNSTNHEQSQPDSHLVANRTTPALMLAKLYQQDIDLQQYWISEKLDGVRAYWDGRQLISRQGYPIQAPLWFTQALPNLPIDGELWSGRGQFDATSAAIRRYIPINEEWQSIQYRVFDLPADPRPFSQRIQTLLSLTEEINASHIQPLSYQQANSHTELLALLQQQVAAGAEGLMLNRIDAGYRGKRTEALLKMKTYQDDEARVVAHLAGKGKYQGKLGSIRVELPSGQQFKIGSGFSDQQRTDPPPIGSIINFKYFGLTEFGTPRFASFIRRLPEEISDSGNLSN